ncbi:MAG TPA: hypothetical protein VMI53_07680 [Opitutaceae bacterium]|nr:hypothetical protein [Opitutaceae bacterium]
MKPSSSLPKFLTALALGAALAALPFAARAGDDATAAKSGDDVTVTGEVLDMACYLDHGASGEKHAACAQKCISSGLPVGLKGSDGKTYLLIGEHKPVNDEFAPYGGKTVTVHGKFVVRDGINLIENVELVKS